MFKRFIPLALAGPLIALTMACTPQEGRAWLNWHRKDPEAAQEFLRRPEIQAELQHHKQPAQRSSGNQSGGTVWDRLAQCESGGNWSINTGNGYYGGLQFLPSTWRANGGSGMPHQASRAEQIRVAENLRAKAGFAPWPACSRKLGLR
jgi:hypothetical protein